MSYTEAFSFAQQQGSQIVGWLLGMLLLVFYLLLVILPWALGIYGMARAVWDMALKRAEGKRRNV